MSSYFESLYKFSSKRHHHTYLSDPLLQLLSENVADKTSYKILDLGSGDGSFSDLISRSGYSVTGVDVSSAGINAALSNFPEVKFIQASIFDLPYDELEGRFDFVVSVETIEHLLYPRELLKAARKCLKPSGKVILTTPYNGYIKNLIIAFLGKTDKHHMSLVDGGHVKFFSVATLTQLLKQEGYDIIDFKFTGRFPFVWKSMICFASPQLAGE